MTVLKKAFSTRPSLGAVLFVVFLSLFEELLFDFPQIRFFQVLMTFRPLAEILIAWVSGAASFLFFCLYVWVALQSSPPFQVLYAVLVAVSSLVQYGYWKAVERFVVPADLKIAAATPLGTWTGASTLYLNWGFLVPVLGFIAVLFLFGERGTTRFSWMKLGFVLLSSVTLVMAGTLTTKSLHLGASFPSLSLTFTRFVVDKMLPAKRQPVEYRHPYFPRNNIVLVIDESIRADHLSINGYERETTPILSALASREKRFHTFGLAVAGATCSYASNALLLTGVRPGLDNFDLTMRYPTVFQYAKAMGYTTYYMDTQTNLLWNGLTDQDIRYIDFWLKARDFGNDYQSDFRAADRIVKIVSGESGNLIVLNKRGVHFLYETSYPADAAIWLPLPSDYQEQPGLVSNAYDNGIAYNVNTFFERLLKDPGILENTTILYTSDHGQTLFEDGTSWLHCNYTSQEATVPLILMGGNLPSIPDLLLPNHSNVLPTLLDLMAVPASQRIHPYASSLFAADGGMDMPSFFFDGSLRLVRFSDY